MTDELEPRVPKMMEYVVFPACKEVVDYDNIVPTRHQSIHQMASDEP